MSRVPIVLNRRPADVAFAQNALFPLDGRPRLQQRVAVLVKILVPAVERIAVVVICVERPLRRRDERAVPAVPQNIFRRPLQHQAVIGVCRLDDLLELREKAAQIPGVGNTARAVVPGLVPHVEVAQLYPFLRNVLRHRRRQRLYLFQAGLSAEGVQRFNGYHDEGHDVLLLAKADELPQAEAPGRVAAVQPAPVPVLRKGCFLFPVKGPGVIPPAHHIQLACKKALFHPVSVRLPHGVADHGHFDIGAHPARAGQGRHVRSVHGNDDLRRPRRPGGNAPAAQDRRRQNSGKHADNSFFLFHSGLLDFCFIIFSARRSAGPPTKQTAAGAEPLPRPRCPAVFFRQPPLALLKACACFCISAYTFSAPAAAIFSLSFAMSPAGSSVKPRPSSL